MMYIEVDLECISGNDDEGWGWGVVNLNPLAMFGFDLQTINMVLIEHGSEALISVIHKT